MTWSLLVGLGCLLFVVAGLAFAWTGRRALAFGALVVALLVTAAVGMRWQANRLARQSSLASQRQALPAAGQEQGYVSSATCQSCHPGEYASWHRTYHRTMTQPANPRTVRGDFDGVTLVRGAWTYHLEQRGEEFWVEMVDPDWERLNRLRGAVPESATDPPRVERRIVMVTGSHHMQTYWVPSQFGRELLNFPFVYLFENRRWIPREDVFLRPPEADRFTDLWNDNCLECHSTRGVPGLVPQQEAFETHAAELGIACEACHGPAAEHVAANHDPARRHALRRSQEAVDPTIVQPARLDSRRASEVCGQCHGVALSDARRWLAEGHGFRPGDTLGEQRFMVLPARNAGHPRLQRLLQQEPAALEGRFWSDGQVRVSGREFSGMVESACYRQGELSCLSCHSMHKSDPNDQLIPDRLGDESCFTCHGEYRQRAAEHTHHPLSSAGSRCQSCHMPYTTYGLLTAMRSHTIASPSVASTVATGRQNACNLCHADRTLAWTAKALEDWYGQPPIPLSPAQAAVSAVALDALAGDAGQRALAAWTLGWSDSQQASGSGWQGPLLGHLLDDPYAAVRYIAGQSLARQPGFESLSYDFIAPPAVRAEARQAALQHWLSQPWSPAAFRGEQVLVTADGQLRIDALAELSRLRNDRPLSLGE
jgi:predicted CXXCH cytochrome family protein